MAFDMFDMASSTLHKSVYEAPNYRSTIDPTVFYGYESKCKTWGTTDLSLFLVLTIQLLGYLILTHTHMGVSEKKI